MNTVGSALYLNSEEEIQTSKIYDYKFPHEILSYAIDCTTVQTSNDYVIDKQK